MTADNIIEVGIDNKERIYIKPETKEFEFIWRDASEINWDDKRKVLYSPKPKEWTYFDWYRQIIMATKGEYGCKLVLTDKTQWTNISDKLKEQICNG
jgi:hypothetical protein